MARVSQKVIKATKEMINSLPDEHVTTCGLCNRTLHDELTVISVKTGAPEMTVVKEFAERYNESKRIEEQITPNAFYGRIKYLRKVNQQDLNSETHQINSTDDSEEVLEDNKQDTELKSESEATVDADSPELNSESHQINIEDEADKTEDSTGVVHVIPEEIGQVELVDSLCQFFRSKLKGSDVIYRTFLRIMDKMSPLEASLMRRGQKIQFEDLNKAISHGIKTGGGPSNKEVADQILEGLNGSLRSNDSIEQIVTMMVEEVVQTENA